MTFSRNGEYFASGSSDEQVCFSLHILMFMFLSICLAILSMNLLKFSTVSLLTRSFAMTHIDNPDIQFPSNLFFVYSKLIFFLRSWCGKQILTKLIMRKVNLFNFAQVETVFLLHSPLQLF